MEERPGLYGKEVVALVVEDALPEVLEWLRAMDEEDPAFSDPEELDHLKEQLTHAVERGLYDGYDTTKALDDAGWEVDGELVDLFEDISWKAYEHHDRLLEEWVTRNGITPQLAVGDKVTFSCMGRLHQGEVTEVRAKTAQYIIFCEEMGHVRKVGNVRSSVERTGVYINFEDTKKAP